MPDHYFSQSPDAKHELRQFTLTLFDQPLSFTTDAGVFSKAHLDKGTALLLSSLPKGFTGRALDLGCGWGAVGAGMAVLWPGADVVLSDINERAVHLAQENLTRNGLKGSVYQGDGLSHLPGQFDLIATNPPIRTGKAVIYNLFAQSAEKLSPGGVLYVVIRKQQGAESAQRYLQTLFGWVSIVGRGGGFRVLACKKEETIGGPVG